MDSSLQLSLSQAGMVENAGTGSGYRVMLMRDSGFVSFCMIDHSKVANVKALRVA